MSEPHLRVEQQGAVLIIRMLREAKRNAVDRTMALELDAAFDRLDDDAGIRAGILTGTTDVFCAGSDMYDAADKRTARGGEYGLARRSRRRPLIAAVEGPALGGGLEIALACDLIVASESATFGLPEVRRGLVPASGGLFRAAQGLPRNIALELLLTGDVITAERAYQVGLANRLTPTGRALESALTLAAAVTRSGPAAVTAAMAGFWQLAREHDDDGWRVSQEALSAVLASPDADEGRRAFAERRAPRWQPS